MEERNIVYITAELLRSSIGLAEIILFLSKIMCMSLSRNKIKWIASCMGITVANALFILLVHTDLVKGFFDIILGVILVLICVEGKTWNKIIKYFFTYFGLGIFYEMVKVIFAIIPIHIIDKFTENSIIDIIILGISIIGIELIASFVINKSRYKELIKEVRGYYILIGIATLFFESAINGFIDNQELDLNALSRTIVNVYQVLLSILTFILWFALILVERDRQKYKRDNLLKDEYLKLSHEHYDSIMWQMKEVSKFKHDMKSHLIAIDYLAKQKNMEGIDEYINELNEFGTELFNASIRTGNNLVDAVLEDIKRKNSDIRLCWKGSIANTNVSDFDLCTIFANLIKNAFEATGLVSSAEKEVQVYIKHYENNIMIEICNPTVKKIDVELLGTFTSKDNSQYHGFGITNVKNTIKKYNGSIDFYSADTSFRVLINMRRGEGVVL